MVFTRRPKPTLRVPLTRTYYQSFDIRSIAGSEFGQIAIAWLILGFCFSAGSLFNITQFLKAFLISLFTLGLGFIAHEFAHRNIARRFGLWAEFRVWPLGLVMALIFALISGGRFIFAAPGAVYIQPRSNTWGSQVSKREYGIISIVGPLMNVIVGIGFLLLQSLGGFFLEIGNIGFTINLWLAAFNLIPFGMMDGYKVFRWNPMIWAITAIPIWLTLFMPTIF
jgi:Zn-dependent protease